MKSVERDELLLEMHGDIQAIKVHIEALPDHENRLRALERFRYAWPGAAVISAVAALALVGTSFHSF